MIGSAGAHGSSEILHQIHQRDPAPAMCMGDKAEKLAKERQITRAEVDAYASRSFERAVAAQASGFLAGEITPVKSESFPADGLNRRGIRLKEAELAVDTHVRASPVEVLAALKPAFGGVQTGGNCSAIVDGAAAVLVGSADYAMRNQKAHPGAHPGRCRHRGLARCHGHRSGAGDPRGA
jgi:acetyl-CoA C-acetyltransferase